MTHDLDSIEVTAAMNHLAAYIGQGMENVARKPVCFALMIWDGQSYRFISNVSDADARHRLSEIVHDMGPVQ